LPSLNLSSLEFGSVVSSEISDSRVGGATRMLTEGDEDLLNSSDDE